MIVETSHFISISDESLTTPSHKLSSTDLNDKEFRQIYQQKTGYKPTFFYLSKEKLDSLPKELLQKVRKL